MLPGIYSAATGMAAAELQQEVISQNLANMDVPGYRRSHVSFESFDAALEQATGDPVAEAGLGTRVATVAIDHSPGVVQATGRNLDVALQGDAYFVLEGATGPLYTRNGVFQMSAEGALVTSSGMPVRGTGGPILLPTGSSAEGVRIGTDGSISVDGTTIGQLELVRFEDNQQLVPVGTSLFSANGAAIPANGEVLVQAGARELSNVNAVTELVRMIAGVRHYEASQRAIQSIAEAVEDNTDPNAG